MISGPLTSFSFQKVNLVMLTGSHTPQIHSRQTSETRGNTPYHKRLHKTLFVNYYYVMLNKLNCPDKVMSKGGNSVTLNSQRVQCNTSY